MRCLQCGKPAAQLHHVIYQQHVKRYGGDLGDERNLIPTCVRCHERHHNMTEPFPLSLLPDAFYAFAAELMGPAAYLYLTRRYEGSDGRLEALYEEDAA